MGRQNKKKYEIRTIATILHDENGIAKLFPPGAQISICRNFQFRCCIFIRCYVQWGQHRGDFIAQIAVGFFNRAIDVPSTSFLSRVLFIPKNRNVLNECSVANETLCISFSKDKPYTDTPLVHYWQRGKEILYEREKRKTIIFSPYARVYIYLSISIYFTLLFYHSIPT